MPSSYSPIPSEIMELLLQYGVRREFKSHEALVRVGEQCKHVYFVLKGGFLRRFYNHSSSVFRTISFHLPTHRPFFTVNESYFAGKVSLYEIKTFQSSEVLAFRRELISQMNQSHKFLRQFHQEKILEALLFENEFKSRLISYNSGEFYDYLCNEFPEIIKHVPSKYIAEVMRISPEWLSKLRQQR